MKEFPFQPLAGNLLVLDHRHSVLSVAPLLEELAERCGQPGAMHWLGYFLDKAVLGRKLPRLVLFLKPEERAEKSLAAEDLVAAALFFEYSVAGVRTGVVATGDAAGFNTVIAPQEQRAEVAVAAAQALTERGAITVVATYDGGEVTPRGSDSLRLLERSGARWATRTRQVPRALPLRATMEETLAQMGKGTRFNLRYYRRRLEKQMRCEFLAEAAPLLQNAELQELNAGSLNPVPAHEFARRIRAASALPGSFLCGLRAEDGRWLSLAGGWRQGTTTVLHWQMNTAGMEKHSIGTVMRSYLLEEEVRRGATQLFIYGGTSHSMRYAFCEDPVSDLVVARRGMRSLLIQGVAHWIRAAGSFGGANFVAHAICSAHCSRKAHGTVEENGRYRGLAPVGAEHVA